MSDDDREVQSKHDRPAAGSGLGSAAPAVAPVVAPVVAPAPSTEAAAPAAPSAPTAPPFAPARSAAPSSPSASGASFPLAPAPADEAADSDYPFDEDEDLPPTVAEQLRRLGPAPVLLTLGSLGSLFFLLRAVTSHTTPVAVLLSAGVVTGLAFGVDSAIASIATYRATQVGATGRAVVLAVIGGIAAVVCAAALAGVLVMILVLNS